MRSNEQLVSKCNVSICVFVCGHAHVCVVCAYLHIHYPPVDKEDYLGGPFAVTFAPDENMACGYIPILDDAIFEGAEIFFIDIDALSDIPLTTGGKVNVTIQDDDTGDI